MKIGYARVNNKNQDIDFQIDILQKFGCDKIYQDKCTSKIEEREQFIKCLKVLQRKDMLVVYRLDRVSGTLKHLINLIVELNKKGIGFISLSDKLDTNAAYGKTIFKVFSAISEFNNNLISERTMEGLESARKRGRFGGRPLKLNKKDVRLARKMLEGPNTTVTEVAAYFKVGRNTLYRYLKG